MEILPEAFTALPRLSAAGFRLVVVTNQPDVARGTQAKEEIERMHGALKARLPIDDFYVCYHDDRDHCACRKPSPGLLLQAASERALNLEGSYLIGDRWRDIDAGKAAGVQSIWLDYGYQERGPQQQADFTAKSLTEAVDWILRRSSKA
jgi:D-glycero-D-manno-heptose 1,7-bisphosphate phosphatase